VVRSLSLKLATLVLAAEEVLLLVEELVEPLVEEEVEELLPMFHWLSIWLSASAVPIELTMMSLLFISRRSAPLHRSSHGYSFLYLCIFLKIIFNTLIETESGRCLLSSKARAGMIILEFQWDTPAGCILMARIARQNLPGPGKIFRKASPDDA
jgi:hypothetical protein